MTLLKKSKCYLFIQWSQNIDLITNRRETSSNKKYWNILGFEGYFEQLESKAVTELSKRTVTDKQNQP